MDGAPQPNLTGPTNELAKERNRAAAQRTLNAWIGQCLGLMATGVAVDQITATLTQKLSIPNAATTVKLAQVTGLIFVAISISLLVVALLQHYLQVSTIRRPDYVQLSVNQLNRVVVSAILLLSLIGLMLIW